MKKLLLLTLLLFSSLSFATDNDVEIRKDFFNRLEELENKVNCRAKFQEQEQKNEDTALQQYVMCLDRLVQENVYNGSTIRYSIQLMVTVSDAKARDKIKDINSLLNARKKLLAKKKVPNLKAWYVPFHIAYPGGSILNDGQYYKILIGNFNNEEKAITAYNIINPLFSNNYPNIYVVQTPFY